LRIAKDRRGQALLVASVAMPMLIGFAGLGTDTVSWFVWKRQLQSAADAGALAGAYVLAFNGSQEQADQAVAADLARNGFDGAAWGAPQINVPPLSGAFAGDPTAFEVVLARPGVLPFSSFFLDGPVTIAARAVARRVANGESCLLALDEARDRTMEFTGSALVTMGCGIAANSSSNEAVYIGGSAQLEATPVSSVGGISIGNSAVLTSNAPLRPLAPPQQDPYENLTPPASPAACTGSPKRLSVKDAQVLLPGRYCGGMTFNAGANATFLPGTYIIDGGDFRTSGGASLTGAGVTFVLTGSGSNYATLNIGGGTKLNLSAPTVSSGSPYAGLLIFQDRNAPTTQGNTLIKNKLLGGADMKLEGAIYFPAQALEFTGGASGNTDCLQVVAKAVSFSGNAFMGNSCDADSGVNKIDQTLVLLVE
ncbi:MAG: pilus assembly protein TadG-related protein, partial [Pseudomonadota bacterium]